MAPTTKGVRVKGVSRLKFGSGCCAVGCNLTSGTNAVSKIKMFRFPKQEERLQAWISAVRREARQPVDANLRICSTHFVSGAPSADACHPDYVPSVFTTGSSQKLDRYHWRRKKPSVESRSTPSREVPNAAPGAGCTARDDQQLFVCKEEWSPSMDQEEPEPPHIKEEQEEPEPPHIKEDQEELWTSQEGQHQPGLEEADIKLTFKPDPVKSEYDEEEQSSQLHPTKSENSEPLASTSSAHIKTEADGEDCGVSEADRNLDPAGGVEPSGEDQLLSPDLSENETDDSDDWEQETKLSQSGVDTLKSERHFYLGKSRNLNLGLQTCKVVCERIPTVTNYSEKVVCERIPTVINYNELNINMPGYIKQEPFDCTVCKKNFTSKNYIKTHLRIHAGDRPFHCPVCEKKFTHQFRLNTHMNIHTGERPFRCTLCTKDFIKKGDLTKHMGCHTKETSFRCTVCKDDFRYIGLLRAHMKIHTGEDNLHRLTLPKP